MRIFLAILLLVTLGLPAQQSVKATIGQCKADLSADMPKETRRAAILVLGKYDTPEVAGILGGCLKDDDVEIRRSALAALAEQPSRLRTQAPAVMNCILDEDVHIRRYATSLIPDCLGIFIRGSVHLSPGSRITTGASKGIPNAAELLTRGLQDTDAEVRRNVLQAAQYFEAALPQEVVLPLLKDPSDEVVSLAIPLAVNSAGNPGAFLEACKPLVSHSNPKIRLALASALSCRPDGLEMLRVLSQDNSLQVRYQALASRARNFAKNDSTLQDEIVNALADGGLVSKDGERLFALLANSAPDRAWQFVLGVLNGEGNDALQEAVWMQIVRHREWQELLTSRQIVDALCKYSDNNRIRMMLLSLLRKHASELTLADVSRLQASPLSSCRKVVFDLLRNLPADLQAEVLSEALLDEDNDLRLQAVNQFSTIRPQGWESVLIATLEDADPNLQRAAASGLLRGMNRNDEVKRVLWAWLPKCSDENLRKQIEARLR